MKIVKYFNALDSPLYCQKRNPLAVLGGIAALAGLGGSIYSANQTNKANKAIAQMTNENNLQIAREVNSANASAHQLDLQQAREFQQQSNWLNSPQYQVQALRESGLNPAQTFGSPSSVGMQSVPSASPAQGATMQPYQYSDVYNTAIANTSNLVSAVSDAYLKYQEAKGVSIDNNTRDALNQQQLENYKMALSKMIVDKSLTKAQRDLLKEQFNQAVVQTEIMQQSKSDSIQHMRLQNSVLQQQAKVANEQALNLAADTAYKRTMDALAGEDLKFKPDMLKAALNETISKIAQNYAYAHSNEALVSVHQTQSAVNKVLSSKYVYDVFETAARTKGIKLSNEQVEKMMPYLLTNVRGATVQTVINTANPLTYIGQAMSPAASVVGKMIGK